MEGENVERRTEPAIIKQQTEELKKDNHLCANVALRELKDIRDEVKSLSEKKQNKLPISVISTFLATFFIQTGVIIYAAGIQSEKLNLVFSNRYTSSDSVRDFSAIAARFSRNESQILISMGKMEKIAERLRHVETSISRLEASK